MSTNDYVRPEHLSVSRWVALPQLEVDDELASWQDVSVRPEAPAAPGFTVELLSYEVLEEDFEAGEGPHPRELLAGSPGGSVALDTGRMAVYAPRLFTPAQSLLYVEALMVEAGIPVASLKEVGREEFYGEPDAGVSAGVTVATRAADGGEGA